jgi:hypothetical protein
MVRKYTRQSDITPVAQSPGPMIVLGPLRSNGEFHFSVIFAGVRDITLKKKKGPAQQNIRRNINKLRNIALLDSRFGINHGIRAAGIIQKEIIQPNGALSSQNGCQYRTPDPVLAIKKAVS